MKSKLLSWDTSSKAGAIAALEWNSDGASPRVVAELTLNVDSSRHSEQLLWGIHTVLEACRWRLPDIHYFGVGVGPGSFTGLRIGVTTAKTFSHTLGKPLVTFSSLAALARSQCGWLDDTYLIVLNDACRGEVFVLRGHTSDVVKYITAGELPKGVFEEAMSPADLVSTLKEVLKKNRSLNWCMFGEAVESYKEFWAELPTKQQILVPSSLKKGFICARDTALLAYEGVVAQRFMPPLEVEPRYLRASNAELKLRAGELKLKSLR